MTTRLSDLGVSTTGNITSDSYFIGNGALLTGISGGGGNVNFSNVASNIIPAANVTYSLGNATNQWKDLWVSNATIYLNSLPLNVTGNGGLQFNGNAVVTSGPNVVNTGNVQTTGNVVGGNLVISSGGSLKFADGSTQTSAYANANVANYLPTYSGVLSGSDINATGNVSVQGNITANGDITAGNFSTLGNVLSSNFSTTGNVSAQGNISAGGNVSGSIFTLNDAGNLTYGSIQRNQNPPYGSESVGIEMLTTTDDPSVFSSVAAGPDYVTLKSTNAGNANVIVQGGYGVTISTSNATGGSLKNWSFTSGGATLFPGSFSTAGNVYAPSVSLTGNILTNGLISTAGNIISGNFDTVGNLTCGGFYTQGDASVAGNISVNGNIRSGSFIADFGLAVTGEITATGNVIANYFIGKGNLLSNIAGANVSGIVAVANVSNIANIAYSVDGANVSGIVAVANVSNIANIAYSVDGANVTNVVAYANVAYNIAGANVSGEVAVANTVSNPSQPNITALGTITSLTANALTLNGALTANGNAQFNADVYFAGNVTIPGNITQISGNSGQYFGNAITGFGALYAGIPTGYTLLNNEVVQFSDSYDGYAQVTHRNINSGAQATTDYVATADNGDDTTNYVDLGVAGSGYNGALANNSLGTSLYPNDSYLYAKGNVSGGNLILGSNQANGVVRIITNGASNIADVVATFSANGLSVAGELAISGGISVDGVASPAPTISGFSFSGANITATGNIAGGNINTSGNVNAASAFVNAAAVITSGRIEVGTSLSATGNIAGSNLITSGAVYSNALSAIGNSSITVKPGTGTNGGDLNLTGGDGTGSNAIGGNVNITTGSLPVGAARRAGNINLTTGTTDTPGNINLSTQVVNVTGAVSATGAISTAGGIIATGAILSSSSITGASFSTAGAYLGEGNVYTESWLVANNMGVETYQLNAGNASVSGNVTAGNLVTAGNVYINGVGGLTSGGNAAVILADNVFASTSSVNLYPTGYAIIDSQNVTNFAINGFEVANIDAGGLNVIGNVLIGNSGLSTDSNTFIVSANINNDVNGVHFVDGGTTIMYSAGNTIIQSNSAGTNNNWVFDSNGNLNIPGTINGTNDLNVTISALDNGSSPALQLMNWDVGAGAPTSVLTVDPNGISITTDILGTPQGWSFTQQGDLTLPGGAQLTGNSSSTELYSDGSAIGLNGLFIATNSTTEILNQANVLVTTATGGNTYSWIFDNNGNLTLPTDTFGINYANGTPVSLGGGANTGNITFNDTTISSANSLGNINVTLDLANATDYQSVFLSVANDVTGYGYAGLEWTDNATATFNETGNATYIWADINGAHIEAVDGNSNILQWDFNSGSGSTGFPGPINVGNGVSFFNGTSQFQGNVLLAIPGSGLTVANRVPFLAYGNGQIGGSANFTFNAGSNTFSTYNAVVNGNLTANGVVNLNGNNVYLNNSANIQGAGNIYCANILTDGYLYANGTPVSFSGGSSNSIANGTSNVSIPVSDGNVVVNAGSATWIFDTNNNLNANGSINLGGNINWIDSDAGISLINANVLEIVANTTSQLTGVTLNNNTETLSLYATNSVSVETNNGAYSWQFQGTGDTVFPGSITQNSYASANLIVPTTADHTWAYGFDSNGGLDFYSQIKFFGDNSLTRGTKILDSNSGNAWIFDGTGNLTLPGNTFAVNYANGSPVVISGGGVAEAPFSIQTNDFTAAAGSRYGVDTTGGSWIATLPTTPSNGDAVFFADAGGAYSTNALVINPGVNTIMGVAGSMTVTTDGQSFGLFWNGTTWRTYN